MGMTLDYAGLISMIQTWAEDTDSEFTTALDNIISLAEIQLQKDLDLEIFNAVYSGTILAGSAGELITKPAGLLVPKSFYYMNSAGSVQLFLKTEEYIRTYWPDNTQSSAPLFYAEYSTTQWLIGPCADQQYLYTVRGITRPTRLSSTNTITWLSTYTPEALFKGCLIQAEKYLKEDPSEVGRISMFMAEYRNEIAKSKIELAAMNNNYYALSAAILPSASPTEVVNQPI